MIGATALLGRVPMWAWAVAALLAWGGWQRHQARSVQAEFTTAKVQAAADRAASAASAAQEGTRRVLAQQGAINAKDQELAAERAAAAAAADAGQRLRNQLAATRARCGAPHPPAVSSSAPAPAAEDLHAYVQRRLDEAADGIARYAGEAAAAGRACERSYDALTAR